MKESILRSAAACAVAAASAVLFASAATAAPKSCDSRANNTHAKLLECVTPEGVSEHLAAFQAIADANNGHRTSGTPGYDASVAYAVSVFGAAGYQVYRDGIHHFQIKIL